MCIKCIGPSRIPTKQQHPFIWSAQPSKEGCFCGWIPHMDWGVHFDYLQLVAICQNVQHLSRLQLHSCFNKEVCGLLSAAHAFFIFISVISFAHKCPETKLRWECCIESSCFDVIIIPRAVKCEKTNSVIQPKVRIFNSP